MSSSVSGILNVGRTQAPISPPSRAHRRGCPMLCFHSDRGVQTSLSVDTAASQALCGTIQPMSSSGSGIFSVGRHTHGRFPRPQAHRRDAPSWRIHRHGGVRTGLTVDTAAFQTLCEPKRAVSSSRSGVLSVGGGARPILPPTRAPSTGLPDVAVSQPPGRSNAPRRRYRGFLHTEWAQPSCAKLWIRHSHRRARVRPTLPPSRAPLTGVPHVAVLPPPRRFYRPHRRYRGFVHTAWGPTRAMTSSGSGILTVGRAYGRLYRSQGPHRRGCP